MTRSFFLLAFGMLSIGTSTQSWAGGAAGNSITTDVPSNPFNYGSIPNMDGVSMLGATTLFEIAVAILPDRNRNRIVTVSAASPQAIADAKAVTLPMSMVFSDVMHAMRTSFPGVVFAGLGPTRKMNVSFHQLPPLAQRAIVTGKRLATAVLNSQYEKIGTAILDVEDTLLEIADTVKANSSGSSARFYRRARVLIDEMLWVSYLHSQFEVGEEITASDDPKDKPDQANRESKKREKAIREMNKDALDSIMKTNLKSTQNQLPASFRAFLKKHKIMFVSN